MARQGWGEEVLHGAAQVTVRRQEERGEMWEVPSLGFAWGETGEAG